MLRIFHRSHWTGRFADFMRRRGIVAGGPFKNMAYVAESIGSQYWPKVFGTYECELWPVFAQLFKVSFDRVIDVGAAEGFYAVGCAIKWPGAQIVAYESEPRGRELIAQMAALNRVPDRVQVKGTCSPEVLSELMTISPVDLTLCIFDVEGAESELCDSQRIPALIRCHLLVETHEFRAPGIGDSLKSRFQATHEITEIRSRPRSGADFKSSVPFPLRLILGRSLVYLVDEWRHNNCTWLLMQPKGPAIRERELAL